MPSEVKLPRLPEDGDRPGAAKAVNIMADIAEWNIPDGKTVEEMLCEASSLFWSDFPSVIIREIS